MPAGKKAPKVTAVRRVLAKAVMMRRHTTPMTLEELQGRGVSVRRNHERRGDLLAQAVAIDGAAVLEKVDDEFGRGDPHEDDEPADDGGEEGKGGHLGHGPLA